ncbi:hypothetical protein IAD21_06451 (plasmid) [Abditibacteriota bacterium]|nr:hypothetical protein IAD21_06451 [Abditibacteriota bacterium]
MSLMQLLFVLALGELRVAHNALDVEVRLNQVLPALMSLNMLDANAQPFAAGFVIVADKSTSTIADDGTGRTPLKDGFVQQLQHRPASSLRGYTASSIERRRSSPSSGGR